MIQRIKYRFRYYLRKITIATGHCPDCGNAVNRIGDDRNHCAECGRFVS